MQQTSNYNIYDRPFKFVNDLLTRNLITGNIEIAFNIILYITIDLFIVFLFYPMKIIKDLVAPSFTGELGCDFYFFKIVVKYANVIVSAAGLILISIPWLHFFTFDVKKKTSRMRATVSYVILEYFTLFFVSIQGYLFGAIGLASVDRVSSTRTDPLIWILNGMVFLLYMITYALWKIVTAFHITMRASFFDVFTDPNNHVYLGINFLIALSHSFRSSPFSMYVIITCILMIFYGSYRLFKSRVPSYTSYIGELVYNKISFDYIIFGIFSIITISIETDSYLCIGAGLVLYFVSFISAALFINYFHTDTYDPTINIYDIQHTPTDTQALTKLRYAVINSCTEVGDVNFLNDIAQLRMSVSLIPDITRICLVKNINLDDIQIRHPTLTPLTRLSMYFLAFQVDLFMKTKLKDESLEITEIVDEIKKATNKVTEAISKFWTDSDDDHRCILDIRSLVTQTNQQLDIALMTYPQSEKIKQLRNDYFQNVLKQYSQVNRMPFTSFHSFINPVDSALNFLNQDVETKKENIHDAPVERYFDDKETRALCPVKFGAILIYIILISFILYYNIYDILFHRKLIEDFDLELIIINATNALTDELLVSVDADFTQPSVTTITDTINVTKKEANNLRSKFQRNVMMPSLTKLMHKTPHVETDEIPVIPGCKRVSMLLNLHEGSVRKTDNKTRKCYTYQLNDNINILYPSIGIRIQSMKKHIESPKMYHFLVYLSLIVVIILLWWAPIYNLSEVKTRLLQSVRRATAFYEHMHRCEYADPTTYFWLAPLIIFIMLAAVLSVDFFLYFFIAKKKEEQILNQMSRLLAIGKIGTLYQDVLTLAMFSFPVYCGDGVDKDFYINMMKKCAQNLTYQVDEFIKLDNLDDDKMPVLDYNEKKNEFFSDVSEFAQLMMEDEFKTDGFQLLYSRYLAMTKLVKIHTTIVPEITSFIIKNVQRTPTNYWNITIITLFLIAIDFGFVDKFIQINKEWIRGATMVIRCAMFNDNDVVKAVLDILEQKQTNFIDDFPFPVIVRRKQGPIIMCNTKLLSFTPHSKTQIVGQRVEDFFGELGDTIEIENKEGKKVTMEIEIDKSGPDHEIIMFKDITELCKTRNEYNELIERLRPHDLQLPVRGVFYNFRLRFSEQLSEEMMLELETIEDKMGVIRIAASASSYVGLAKEYVDVKIILKFVCLVASKIEDQTKNVVACLVKGTTSVIPLVSDAVPVLCGETASRSNERVINGEFGCIYIDEGIINKEEFDASPMKIEYI